MRSRAGPPEPKLPVLDSFHAAESAASFHTALDFNDDPTVLTPTGERRTRQDARQKIRDELFGPGSDAPRPARQYNSSPIKQTYLNTTQAEPRLDGLSPSPISSTSPVSPGSSNVEDLLVALREITKTASTDELKAIRIALNVSDERQPDAAEEHATIKDPTISSLLRRKTLNKPGIATRTTPSNVLRKPRPAQPSTAELAPKRQTWSEDMFVNSPLSKIAHLQDDDQLEVAVTRCETPSEVGYPLGAYQMGALRVTNGAASPEPSLEQFQRRISRDVSGSHLRRMDDYFCMTAEDLEHTANNDTDDGMSSHLTPPMQHEGTGVERQHHHLLLNTSEMESRSANSTDRRLARSPHSPAGPRRPPMSRSKTEGLLVSRSSHASEGTDVLQMYSVVATSNPFLPMGAVGSDDGGSIEQQHRDEWHPARETIPPSLSIGAVQAPEQDLAARELFHRDSHLGRASSGRSMAVSDVSSAYGSSVYPDSVRAHDDLKQRPRLTVDSGYGSQASLRTKLSSVSAEEAARQSPNSTNRDHSGQNAATVRRPSPQEDAQSVAPSIISMGTMLKMAPSGAPGTPIQRRSPPVTPTLGDYEAPDTSRSMNNLAVPERPTPLQPRSAPVSPAKGEESPRKERKKLQKRRKSFMEPAPIALQDNHSMSSIPAVPIDVASKYSRRMSQNPDMQNLEHTFKSAASGSDSKWDAASSLVSTDPSALRFPSPAPDKVSRGRKQKRRSLGGDAPSHGFLRSLSRKRSKSRGDKRDQVGNDEVEQDDEPSEIEVLQLADFGSVADMLGASPYELATPPSLSSHRRRPSSEVIEHPHQISRRSRSRGKSVGMNEEEASRFALQRSRDRQMTVGELHADRSRPSPSERDRRQRDSVEPARNRRARPRSAVVAEVPPVPALPACQKPSARPKSAHLAGMAGRAPQIALEREQTMAALEQGQPPATDDWEAHARHWRMRRRSIGEGLLSRASVDAVAAERAGAQKPANSDDDLRHNRGSRAIPLATPHDPSISTAPQQEQFPAVSQSASRTRYYGARANPDAATGEQPAGARPRSLGRPLSSHPLSAARTASPTPSIKERAAMFERVAAEQGGRGVPASASGPSSVSALQPRSRGLMQASSAMAGMREPLPEERKKTSPLGLRPSKSLRNVSAFLRRVSSGESSASTNVGR